MASERSEPEGACCPVCPAGTLRTGTTTLTIERGKTTILLKDIPPDVCGVCGESYLNEDVSAAVYEKAEEAIDNGAHFGVRRWNSPTKTSTQAYQ